MQLTPDQQALLDQFETDAQAAADATQTALASAKAFIDSVLYPSKPSPANPSLAKK